MGKIFAFTDIHGEYYKLVNLVRRLDINAEEDTLVFLGDNIDRGTHSCEVIEYLMFLNKIYNCVFVTGNHEAMLLGIMDDSIDVRIFLANGGEETIDSYKRSDYIHVPKRHIEFIKSMVKYYETEDYIFVHADILPGKSLAETSDNVLLWGETMSNYEGYKGKTIVCGHRPYPKVTNKKNIIRFDTGGCFSGVGLGRLTCVELPARKFYSEG